MRFATIILIVTVVLGCDTSRNTPYLFENFFIRYYGTDGNQVGVDMIANDDGTFMLLGNSTLNEDDSQIYLVKVNSDGIVLWEKFYTGTGREFAKDIEPVSNGVFVILADRIVADKGSDIYFFTIDSDGTKISEGEYSKPGSANEFGNSITTIFNGTSPEGFIVAGYTEDSIDFIGTTALFPRFNLDGTKYTGAWGTDEPKAGAEKDDFGLRIIQTSNSTFPFSIFGYTNSEPISPGPGFNYWAMPVTETMGGSKLTTALLDGSPPDNSDEILGSVYVSNSEILMLGILSKGTENDQICVAKVTHSANTTLSPKIISGINLGEVSDLEDLAFRKVTATTSTSSSLGLGYLIAANTMASGNSDIVLTKIDFFGNVIWDAPVILGGLGEDYECAIHELPNGRIILFGTMQLGSEKQSKMALMKLNSKGEFKD